jgi:hypothetical protein
MRERERESTIFPADKLQDLDGERGSRMPLCPQECAEQARFDRTPHVLLADVFEGNEHAHGNMREQGVAHPDFARAKELTVRALVNKLKEHAEHVGCMLNPPAHHAREVEYAWDARILERHTKRQTKARCILLR